MNKKRNILCKKSEELELELRKIAAEIKNIDYANRFKIKSKFLGKCYEIRPMSEHGERWIRCFLVYAIDPDSLELKTVEVRYYKKNIDTYYSIEYARFNPEYETDSVFKEKHIKITRAKFDEHFKIVNNRILDIIAK